MNTLLEINKPATELEIHAGGRDALLLWGQRVAGPAATPGLVLASAAGNQLDWIDPAVLLAGTFVDAAGDTMTGDLLMDGADILPLEDEGANLGGPGARFAGVFATAVTAATLAGALAWGNVTDTPDTLAGYGITNAATSAEVAALSGAFAAHMGAVNPHAVTKAQVGLGNVEDTALSTWPGSVNLTTLGALSGHLLPNVDNGLNVGSPAFRWANVRATSLTGTLATAAQPNVTSLGTLTSLSVTGTSTLTGNVGVGVAPVVNHTIYAAGTATSNAGFVYGVRWRPEVDASTTAAARAFEAEVRTVAAAFTLDIATAFYAKNASKGAGSTINTQYGFYIENLTAGTTNWAVYNAGSANVYLGTGSVSVGTTTTTASALRLADTYSLVWSDVTLSRGAANRLDLGSGDSLRLSGGGYYESTWAGDGRVLWSGNTGTGSHQAELRWTGIGGAQPRFGFVPSPGGTADYGKEFSFDFSAGRWTFDGALTIGGGLLIGTTTAPSAGSGKVLVFGDNTGDPTLGASTAALYAKTDTGVVEMFARDSAGNSTKISPHDPVSGEWVFDSRNTRTGRRLTIRTEALLNALIDATGLDRDTFISEYLEA